MSEERTWTLPNELTMIRIACAPVLLVLAAWDQHNIFLMVLGLAFFLDAIDGPLARRLHQVSRLGSKMDSIADFLIYVSFAAGAALLWPEVIKREIVAVMMILGSVFLPAMIGVMRFHKPTSYHTWLVKVAAVCTSITGFFMFLGAPAWPFRIAAMICVVAALEEILITVIIKEARHDVKTIWHVFKSDRA